MNLSQVEIRVVIFVLLGVFALLYGLFVMVNTAGTKFFLVWYAIGALCLAYAWARHTAVLIGVPQPLRAFGAFACMVATSFTVFHCISIYKLGQQPYPSGLNALIVLGAQVKSDGSPSRSLAWRLDTALAYLEQNPSTRVIVSGGQGPNEPISEAQCMASYLQQHGISPTRIDLEDQSTSTRENLTFSLNFCEPTDAVGIVTNDFHVHRALLLANQLGYTRAYGMAAPSDLLFLPNNLFREFLALLVRGNLFTQVNTPA